MTTADAAGEPQVRVAAKALANAEANGPDASSARARRDHDRLVGRDSTAVVQAMLPVPDLSSRGALSAPTLAGAEYSTIYMRTRDDPRCRLCRRMAQPSRATAAERDRPRRVERDRPAGPQAQSRSSCWH